jgi:uncharacterized protein (TIGR02246 family)
MRPLARPAVHRPVPIFLLLSLVLSVTAPAAWAGPKEDVASAMEMWATTFSAESPDRIVALYDREAVLWGTLSPTRRDGTEAIRDYFVRAFAALPARKVAFRDPFIRVYGDTAINTGYYTITWEKDGQTKTLPARYSFTYLRRDGGWMIVDHHSSAVPDPNLVR